MISNIIQYRRFIWNRAWLNVRHRYAATALGLVWNILQPLMMIVLYSIVFSRLMESSLDPTQGVKFPYSMYLCAGLIPWMAFSQCVAKGCNALLSNASYLRKMPIPEYIFFAQNAVTATIQLGMTFTLLMLGSMFFGVRPTWCWLLLPIPIAMLMTLGFGVSMLLGTLNVFFRDIGASISLILRLTMWTAPIIYHAKILPKSMQEFVVFHPLYPSTRSIRELFLYDKIPDFWMWGAMFLWPALFTLLGHVVLRKLRHEVRDLI